MARPTIDNIRSLGDFATVMNWNMYFATWPTASSFQGYALSNDDFNFRCISTEVPVYDSQPTTIAVRGQVIRQPGIYTPSGTISFSMYETVDNKVSNMLKQWREICWQSQSGVQQTKADCEATLYLERLDRQDNVIWYYLVYGAFLEMFDPTGTGGLSDTSADVLRPQIRLSYDYFLDQPVSSSNATPVTTPSGSGGIGSA